jgi:DNA-binding transcriptional MerR regulator
VARSVAIRIGELAQRTGCNIETIRYYERVGLLRHPPRSAGRYRLYETEDVRRLAFVLKLPRFRRVVLDLGDYGSVVTASIAAS